MLRPGPLAPLGWQCRPQPVILPAFCCLLIAPGFFLLFLSLGGFIGGETWRDREAGGSLFFPSLLAGLFWVFPGGMQAGPSGWAAPGGELLLPCGRAGLQPKAVEKILGKLIALRFPAKVIGGAELSLKTRFESQGRADDPMSGKTQLEDPT